MNLLFRAAGSHISITKSSSGAEIDRASVETALGYLEQLSAAIPVARSNREESRRTELQSLMAKRSEMDKQIAHLQRELGDA